MPKLTPQAIDQETLAKTLAERAADYHDMALALDTDESDDAVYWRIVFALLTPNTPIEASLAVYRVLRSNPAGVHVADLKGIIGKQHVPGAVVMYASTKARFINHFDRLWQVDRTLFTRNGESEDAWRDRLAHNVKGLATAKASFAVALVSPSTSDVCCIDTHIYQMLEGGIPTWSGFYSNVKRYKALEAIIRGLARRCGVSTFAAQWCLWDAKRGMRNDHRELAD